MTKSELNSQFEQVRGIARELLWAHEGHDKGGLDDADFAHKIATNAMRLRMIEEKLSALPLEKVDGDYRFKVDIEVPA